MASWLVQLHVILAAAWLGCVLTEVLFERALLAEGPSAHRLLARLHRRVDLAVELPALVGVALSGAFLWWSHQGALDALLAWKIGIGGGAILANLWCIRLVLCRCAQAEAGDEAGFAATDQAQHRWGAVVLLALLAALAIGLVRYAV